MKKTVFLGSRHQDGIPHDEDDGSGVCSLDEGGSYLTIRFRGIQVLSVGVGGLFMESEESVTCKYGNG